MQTITSDNGCCGDGVENTREMLNKETRKSRRKSVGLFAISNPIPSEVSDPDELSNLFDKHKLIPFAGWDKHTGHKTLTWYLMLAKLSPTHGGCISKLSRYIFGSPVMLTRGEDIDFFTGSERQIVLGPEAQGAFDDIKSIVPSTEKLKALSKRVFWSYKATGNAFVRLDISQVNGQFSADIKYIRTTSTMYRVPAADEVTTLALSPIWTDAYLEKHPFELVPRYPNFKEENGVFSTIFHLSTDYSLWYGRPDSEPADLNKYREMQQTLYSIKQNAAGFIGNVIIEVEDDGSENGPIDDKGAKQDGFGSFAGRIEENYTQKSDDPQAVIITSRPMGSRQMFVFQIKPNTNENYYKTLDGIDENKILRAHHCTLRFMGFDASTGFSSTAFLDDYVLNMEPVINDLRMEIMKFINDIYTAVYEMAGRTDLNDYNLNFDTPISGILNQYKQTMLSVLSGANQPNNGSNIGPGGNQQQPG